MERTGNIARRKIRIGGRKVSLGVLAIVAIVGLGVTYISLVSNLSNKGVTYGQLESQASELKGEKERLMVESARLQSLEVIDQAATEKIEVGNNPEKKPEELSAAEINQETVEIAVVTKPKYIRTRAASFLVEPQHPVVALKGQDKEAKLK